jgi:hypothetical protein
VVKNMGPAMHMIIEHGAVGWHAVRARGAEKDYEQLRHHHGNT